jgi:hypothetical protein
MKTPVVPTIRKPYGVTIGTGKGKGLATQEILFSEKPSLEPLRDYQPTWCMRCRITSL